MRILIVTQHFWPSLGGAEVMLRRLAAQWTAAKNQVEVLTCRWQSELAADELLDGFRIHRLPVSNVRWLGTILYLRQLDGWLRRNLPRFDVVYTSMLKHAAWASIAAGKASQVPVVLRAEGAGSTGDVAWQRSARLGSLLARRCRQAQAIVAPSPAVEQLLDAGYERQQVHLLANGVPIPAEPWRRHETAAFRRQLDLEDRPTLCFAGRLHRDKGLADLIAAIPLLEKCVGRIQVLLVGDGPERGRLETQAIEQGLADRLHLFGVVPNVEPYLRASDLFVLPSYQEGLSVALLEALALGLPTIASDIRANRDVLPAELLPLFAPRDPAALAVAAATRLSGDSHARSCEQARRLVADQFGLVPLADRHLKLFESVRRHRGS